jgi:hypothetical protein
MPVKIAVTAVRFDLGEELPLHNRGRRGVCRAPRGISKLVGRLQALRTTAVEVTLQVYGSKETKKDGKRMTISLICVSFPILSWVPHTR